MTRYVIREMGWVYNDQTFDADYPYEIEGIYEDKAFAEEYLKELQREAFILNFDRLHQLEYKTASNSDWFELRKGMFRHLVHHLGWNPTILLFNPWIELNMRMFPYRPDDEEIDRLVEASGICFFHLAEMNAEEQVWYKARLNAHYEGYHGHLEKYNSPEKLIFFNLRQAFERFFEQDFKLFLWRNQKAFTGSLASLSPLPKVLEALINRSPYLDFKNAKLTLDKEIDLNTAMELSGLMKEPFLILDEWNLTLENYIDEQSQAKQHEHYLEEWDPVLQRFWEFELTNAEIQQHPWFLEEYCIDLTQYHTYEAVAGPLFAYLRKHLPSTTPEGYGGILYQNSTLEVFGLILEQERHPDGIQVRCVLGTQREKLFRREQPGVGVGETIEEAFIAAQTNFLEQHGPALLELIIQTHSKG